MSFVVSMAGTLPLRGSRIQGSEEIANTQGGSDNTWLTPGNISVFPGHNVVHAEWNTTTHALPP